MLIDLVLVVESQTETMERFQRWKIGLEILGDLGGNVD